MDSLFDAAATGMQKDGRAGSRPAGGVRRHDDAHAQAPVSAAAPLAVRMRPSALEDLVGQEHLLGASDSALPLRAAVRSGRPHSMILHGPPGSGKTTLARIIAASARDAACEELSAVQAGRAEVREVIARASERRRAGRGTILFLDEIHRFNRAQQDALLPAVETGLITLIGATTENPRFEVGGALLSRTRIYELKELTTFDLQELLRRALRRGECAAHSESSVEPAAIELLAARSGGDARFALGALELACAGATDIVTLDRAAEALQRPPVHYDKGGDNHYDTISAWIKATRGSDPDASIYYLAVMLEGGEDPRFIARRMVILASEDIGNADPQALTLAAAAAAAVEHVGLPECRYALAQAAIYLSLAPKSDAAKRAIGAARELLRTRGAEPPPAALRSGVRGDGYENPHREPSHIGTQQLTPDGLAGVRFYDPDDAEAALRARLQEIRKARGLDD